MVVVVAVIEVVVVVDLVEVVVGIAAALAVAGAEEHPIVMGDLTVSCLSIACI